MKDSQGDHETPETSPWEWVVAAASTLLVLAVIGFTTYQATTGPATPPLPSVQVDSVVSIAAGGFLAQVRVRNAGSATAAAVMLEGELSHPDGTRETAQATVDYLPGGGSREAGLVFASDPRRFPTTVRVTGFELP